VTVPGAVDGWVQCIDRFGSRSLSEALEPAARLAESGHFVSRHIYASFRSALPVLKNWGSMSLWSATGEPPRLYDRLTQPLLAKTLRAIGQTHGEAFYRGNIAQSIVKSITDAGGILSLRDLAEHRSEWVEPLSSRYRNATIFTTPPATQGFALLQALAVIDQLLPQSADVSRLSMLHLLIEAVAEALEERDLVVCDRARMTVDIRSIFGKKRVDEIVATIKADNAKSRKPSTASTKGRGDTAHLSVVDRNGLSVSLIQSLYFDFGSGIAVENGGFTLQNRGAAFSLEEGSPNELRPHTRPPHTLTPTIVALDSGTTYVLGCMGGDGQVQTQVQLITNMIDGELDPQQAISKPRWYLDRANPDGPTLLAESGIDENILVGLQEAGHKVTVTGPSEEVMGHAQVIARLPGGVLVGGSDPRSDGQVYGW
jgi:gamma-glutamyltranspeptidase/glutathione hydrolase